MRGPRLSEGGCAPECPPSRGSEGQGSGVTSSSRAGVAEATVAGRWSSPVVTRNHLPHGSGPKTCDLVADNLTLTSALGGSLGHP